MYKNQTPVDWEVFKNPPVEPVHYYLILKKKREFTQLIKKHDPQISKSNTHYCCIMASYSYLNSRDQIYILIFDNLSDASCIGLKIKIDNESFVEESNFLIKFLKKLNRDLFYHIKENCIFIQCTSKWEMFYLLYDEYLRQYMLTIIGTQFFYHFVYEYFIQKDIQLLQMLYKGSRIIRLSTKSIFYELYRVNKISIANFVYILTNVPKSITFSISNSNSKLLPSLYSKLIDWKLHLPIKRKKTSKLRVKKIKMDLSELNAASVPENVIPSFAYEPKNSSCRLPCDFQQYLPNSNPAKRKLNEIDSRPDIRFLPSTSKFSKLSNSDELVDSSQWETYSSIRHVPINNYSSISCIQDLVPKLYKNEPQNCILSNFSITEKENYNQEELCELKFSDEMQLRNSLEKCLYEGKIMSDTKEYCDNIVNISRKSIYEAVTPEKKDFQVTNNSKISSGQSSNVTIFETGLQKAGYFLECNFKNTQSSFPEFDDFLKINEDILDASDVDFLTATGKPITVSQSALATAQNIMEDVLSDNHPQPDITANTRKNSVRKANFKSPAYFKSPLKITYKHSELISDATENIDSVKKVNQPLNKSDHLNNIESSDFTTAGGRNVLVSKSSVQIANKILQEVLNEESPENADIQCKKPQENQNNSFAAKSSKFSHQDDKMEIDDKLEDFFSDSFFDTCDKELENNMECNADKGSNSKKDDNTKSSIQRTRRKSLGTRRNIKYSML